MNRLILEVPLTSPDVTVDLAVGARILALKVHNRVPTLFVLVNPATQQNGPHEPRRFVAVTGAAVLKEEIELCAYVDSLGQNQGPGLHVFEVPQKHPGFKPDINLVRAVDTPLIVPATTLPNHTGR